MNDVEIYREGWEAQGTPCSRTLKVDELQGPVWQFALQVRRSSPESQLTQVLHHASHREGGGLARPESSEPTIPGHTRVDGTLHAAMP